MLNPDSYSSINVLKESNENMVDNNYDDDTLTNINPLHNFLFVLNAEDTKKQYPKRLKMFFDFGTLKMVDKN